SSSSEYELAIPADLQVVAKQRLIPLHDPLFEQYDLLECRCFMGLFSEIKRAWITVDHRLFLWNCEDESDFYSFDEQEQIIVSVSLVRPKPGGAFLLGAGYDGGKLAGMRGSGSGGEVTLYATQVSVPADGVAMTSMCGTSDGRVSMSGNDGALDEFAYQSEDGWLTKKAKKINLTSTIASGGRRLYFSTVKRMQRYYEASALAVQAAEQQPECFNLVHVRLPPDLQPAMARSMQNFALRQALNVHTAFYGNGTALLAHTWNEDHDSIVGVAPSCAQILARILGQSRATLAEHALRAELLVRASEVISFLCLLADFNLPVISDGIAEVQRMVLAGIPFSQLAALESGRVACKELILALINSQLKQHVSIDNVSDVLSKRCSTIFSSSDVALYKALKYLKLAAEAEEGAKSVNLANEALALPAGIAATLSAKQVREICDQFEALGQYAAVAPLSLACTSESGPSNDALAFWSDGAPENDACEAVYRKRMECYKCVIELLDKRRTIVLNAKSLAQLPSNDALFHFALFQFVLYDWLLDNDQSVLLFQMRAPFVEKYLSLEPRTLEKCDTLWHFYILEGQFGKASLVQRELAGSGRNDFEIDLARRIEYFPLLIGNGKIAIDAMRGGKAAHVTRELLSEEEEINELATLLRECEDQLEIAQVQMEIQQQLRALGRHETLACMPNCRLFTMTELYERFAEPLRLWDAMLLILKVLNHDDSQMVEEIWMTILRTILDDAQRTGLMVVTSKVSKLGVHLYPSAAASPLPLIMGILVELVQERPDEYVRGYVGDTLVHANVSHWAVFEALNTLYIRNAAGAQKAVAEFLVREIAALTTAWMDSAHSASADSASPSPDKDSMPVMAVDEALSQYIINAILNNNVELKNEIQRMQEHIRRIF
ncbi:hypothetical protein GGI24_002207, partial [Coemansia furcata]